MRSIAVSSCLFKQKWQNWRLQITSCGSKILRFALESNAKNLIALCKKSLIIVGMVSLWFFFILSVITKLIASSN